MFVEITVYNFNPTQKKREQKQNQKRERGIKIEQQQQEWKKNCKENILVRDYMASDKYSFICIIWHGMSVKSGVLLEHSPFNQHQYLII